MQTQSDDAQQSMQTIVAALGAEHGELAAILERLDDADWHRPTRCEGWDVADVVLHLAQTDELALASTQGRFAAALEVVAAGIEGPSNVDEGAAAMVAKERGLPTSELLERWRTASTAMCDAFLASDPHRRVDWVSGQVSTRTLATTRLAECWIHAGDVANAVDVEQRPTDRLEHIARLAWRTLPYAFARGGKELSGPVAFVLEAPSGGHWQLVPDTEPATVIEGSGADLCLVAARRVPPNHTSLHGTGPDANAVLELVRTYA